MLFERWTGARVLKRWMQNSLFYRNLIWIVNWSQYQTKIGEKRFEFIWALAQEKTQIRHDLPPLPSRILYGSLLYVDDPFSVCFLEFFVFPSHVALRCKFAFWLMPFFLSFAFLLPYSAYLRVLSNFLARFPRLALRLLLLAFFGCSVSFLSCLFSLKTLSPRTWVITISSGWQSFSFVDIVALRFV